MKVKKILAGITALCMLYGAISASNQQIIFIEKTMTANAADSYSENSGTTENGLEYLIYTDVDCIAITGYSGSEKNVEIPASIDGSPVTSIGEYAFYDCTGLAEITIPDSVTRIAYSAFAGCTGLTEITIPDSVTSIGGDAFVCCTGLTSITIPDSVTSIGGRAFGSCTGLTEITIPNSVTSIGYETFAYCTGLTKITIPNSVTSIGNNAFYDCTGLTEITIPNSVTSIGSSAFSGCTGLTEITIPDSVTSIFGSAFLGCTGLTAINTDVNSNHYSSIDGVLFSKDKSCLISYPIGKSNKKYTIPDSVTSIGSYAFSGCTGLTSIIIPDSVTSIGYRAFGGCTGLTSITIPASVTSIDDSAFSGCTELTSITIKNPECEIGDSTDTISNTAAIYGYDDSTAQAYAEKYNRKFVSLGEKPNIPISKTGDADLNGTIDAIDASIALTIYALKSTGGDVSSYTDEQLAVADADKNDTVDAIDASHILSYYAYISTGGSKTFDEFI